MPQPAIGDQYVQTLLSNVLVGWIQDQKKYAALRVFPRVPVELPAGVIPQYKIDDLYRAPARLRAPGDEAVEIGWNTDNTKSFLCAERAFKHLIPDPVAGATQRPYDQDRDATIIVGQMALISLELDFMNTYWKPSFWGTTWTGANTADSTHKVYWDVVGSTPVEDVQTAMDTMEGATGFRPNKLTLARKLRTALTLNPEFLDRVKFGGSPRDPALVTDAALAEVFDVEEVVVAAAVRNSAAEGATAAIDFMAGTSALLSYAPANPSIWQPSAGYIFPWTGPFGASGDLAYRVKKYRWEIKSGDYVEAQGFYDMQAIATSLGTFFYNMHS